VPPRRTDSSNNRRKYDGKYCPRLHSQHVQAAIIENAIRRVDEKEEKGSDVLRNRKNPNATSKQRQERSKGMVGLLAILNNKVWRLYEE
jgi:hypothetical protein